MSSPCTDEEASSDLQPLVVIKGTRLWSQGESGWRAHAAWRPLDGSLLNEPMKPSQASVSEGLVLALNLDLQVATAPPGTECASVRPVMGRGDENQEDIGRNPRPAVIYDVIRL